MIEETPEERLKRIGRTVHVSAGSSFGASITPSASYLLQEYKFQKITSIIGRVPIDENGLGYDLTPVTSEV